METIPELAVSGISEPLRTCSKVQYSSYREAQGVINDSKKHFVYAAGKRANRRMGKKDKRLQRSYRCEECGFWHITSQPDWINKFEL